MKKRRQIESQANPNYPKATSSGLQTGTVKFYRSPRKKSRIYKPCDVARIAVYCSNDNPDVTKEQLLACVAKSLGFTHISLQTREGELASSNESQLVLILEDLRNKLDNILRDWGFDL